MAVLGRLMLAYSEHRNPGAWAELGIQAALVWAGMVHTVGRGARVLQSAAAGTVEGPR